MRLPISYISAAGSDPRVQTLEVRMREFYSRSVCYYADIDFAVEAWKDSQQLIHKDLVQHCWAQRVCEVGCGRAGILRAAAIPQNVYWGCDYSEELMLKNQLEFPNAKFEVIRDPPRLPFTDGAFDFVFSVFVLEHVVRPQAFMAELVRVCAPSGKIAILCPDFFARGNISSQVMGRSNLSGREKLRKGHLLDAFVTAFLSRIAMPVYLKTRLRNAARQPVYLLNTRPACFERPFFPDADAVYVTHQAEIDTTFLSLGFERRTDLIPQSAQNYASQWQLIYGVYQQRRADVVFKAAPLTGANKTG